MLFRKRLSSKGKEKTIFLFILDPEQPYVKPSTGICLNPGIARNPFDLRSCRDRAGCRLPLILDRSRRDFPMANEISPASETSLPFPRETANPFINPVASHVGAPSGGELTRSKGAALWTRGDSSPCE